MPFQVRKLTELFRPVTIHSTLLPIHAAPKVEQQDKEASNSFMGQFSHLHRERSDQNPYVNIHGMRHNVLPHESEQRNLFLTAHDYHAFGLQENRRNLIPPSHLNPILEPYKRDHGREQLHQLGTIYREDVPLQLHVERLGTDPIYLNNRVYQAYSDGVDDNPHSALSKDLYSQSSYRDELSTSSLAGGSTMNRVGNLPPWREVIQDRLHSTYAVDALPEYSQTQQYHITQSLSMPAPVSSRYAFDGLSGSYR